ncbi:hypothetical protein G6011_06216 [Alternaria panax]|uniref:Uncharacterized protein n=1 Tax=Alternaria panax TaxID=48097 RepID=A0AAD4FI23_9PLEO|nr:hypothetical protein G6011_06216 [Alternaria panax]
MHSGTKDQYAPDRERQHQRRSNAPHQSSIPSSIPIRSAASSSSSYTVNRHSSRRSSSNNTPTESDTKKLDTPTLLLSDVRKREDIVARCEAELQKRQRALRRREDEVEHRGEYGFATGD